VSSSNNQNSQVQSVQTLACLNIPFDNRRIHVCAANFLDPLNDQAFQNQNIWS